MFIRPDVCYRGSKHQMKLLKSGRDKIKQLKCLEKLKTNFTLCLLHVSISIILTSGGVQSWSAAPQWSKI